VDCFCEQLLTGLNISMVELHQRNMNARPSA
jgi:hypothetical protein